MKKSVFSSSFFKPPSSRLGWWAVGLAVAFIFLGMILSSVIAGAPADAPWQNAALSSFGIAMRLYGLVIFAVSLIAIIRSRERSWLVWLTLLQGLATMIFLLG